jgi:hypothetical protein
VDVSRLRTGEIIAGIGGIAMFVFLFFDWFSGGAELTGGPGNLTVSTIGVSGWDALTDLPGFLIILAAVSGIALACLAAAGQRVNIPVPRGGVTASLGVLAVLLILWRMFAGSPTLKIGVFLGLAAAVGIAVGALMALAEEGFQPFVAVAAVPATVAAASAPPATPKPPPAAASTTKARPSSKKRSTAKKSSAPKRSAAKKRLASKSSSRSTATKRSSSTRSKATTAKRKKSTRSTTSKRSGSAKSRSSGGKRSSSSRKK